MGKRKSVPAIDEVHVTYLKPDRPPLGNIARSLSEIEEMFAITGKPSALPGWKVRIGLDGRGEVTSLLVGRLSDEPSDQPGESDRRAQTVTMLNWPRPESHDGIKNPTPLIQRLLQHIPLFVLVDGDPDFGFEGGRKMIRREFADLADPRLWGEPPVSDEVIERKKGGRKPTSDLDLAKDALAYVRHKRKGGTIKTLARERGYSESNMKRRIAQARDRRGLLSGVRHNQKTTVPYLTPRCKKILTEEGIDVD